MRFDFSKLMSGFYMLARAHSDSESECTAYISVAPRVATFVIKNFFYSVFRECRTPHSGNKSRLLMYSAKTMSYVHTDPPTCVCVRYFI